MTPTRADLAKQPAEVAAMFDDVAARYDVVNDVLSLGRDRSWRKVVARAVGATKGELVLDGPIQDVLDKYNADHN